MCICGNLVKFIDTRSSRRLVPLWCTDPRLFIHYTDEDVFAKADSLHNDTVSGLLSEAQLKQRSTELGINENKYSLLLHPGARKLYKPVGLDASTRE